jgi:hypothetical protein
VRVITLGKVTVVDLLDERRDNLVMPDETTFIAMVSRDWTSAPGGLSLPKPATMRHYSMS